MTLPQPRPPGTAPGILARPKAPEPLGQWVFWADRLITDDANQEGTGRALGAYDLGPVECSGFGFNRQLNAFGSGEASVVLARTPGLSRADVLRLWSWRLWAYFGGRPVWCAFPTGIADEGKGYVTVTLTEVCGFLNKRVHAMISDYRQVEQKKIAADLANPLIEVDMTIVQQPGNAFFRDRRYEYLESGTRAQLLKNLTEVIDGPQFRTEYAMWADGKPHAIFRIGYPRAGADTGLTADVPGNAQAVRQRWDSDEFRTMTFAVGDLPEQHEEGAQKPVRSVFRPQRGTGIPLRMDAIDDYPGTILESTLQERATSAAAKYAAPVLEMTTTVSLDDPPVASYAPGDTVAVRIKTPLVPDGIQGEGQLIREDISMGEGYCTWTVAMAVPPPRPRETLIQGLQRLDWMNAGMFRKNLGEPPGGWPG